MSDFSAPDCGILPEPLNGEIVSVTRTTVGGRATYQCKTGFEDTAKTSMLRICQNDGAWSGSPPSCERSEFGESQEYVRKV